MFITLYITYHQCSSTDCTYTTILAIWNLSPCAFQANIPTLAHPALALAGTCLLGARLRVLFTCSSSCTQVLKKIDEVNSNTTVDSQNQLITEMSANVPLEWVEARCNTYGIFLCGCHLLYSQHIAKKQVRREVFANIFLDEFHGQIRIIHRSNLVANTRD